MSSNSFVFPFLKSKLKESKEWKTKLEALVHSESVDNISPDHMGAVKARFAVLWTVDKWQIRPLSNYGVRAATGFIKGILMIGLNSFFAFLNLRLSLPNNWYIFSLKEMFLIKLQKNNKNWFCAYFTTSFIFEISETVPVWYKI